MTDLVEELDMQLRMQQMAKRILARFVNGEVDTTVVEWIDDVVAGASPLDRTDDFQTALLAYFEKADVPNSDRGGLGAGILIGLALMHCHPDYPFLREQCQS